MTAVHNVQTAQTNHVTQYSALLTEWLECQDFILSAKAESFGMLPAKVASLRHFQAASHAAFSVPHFENKMISDELKPAFGLIFKGSHAIEVAAQNVIQKIKSPLEQLRETPLGDKREVLRYMQIISSPVAAAYLGITEYLLNALKKSSRETFGAHYAGGYCYSLEELSLIAQNLEWACNWVYDKAAPTPFAESTVLDQVVLVDEFTAMAMTDTVLEDLELELNTTECLRRPFRLSDLEKIRVAKLNASA